MSNTRTNTTFAKVATTVVNNTAEEPLAFYSPSRSTAAARALICRTPGNPAAKGITRRQFAALHRVFHGVSETAWDATVSALI